MLELDKLTPAQYRQRYEALQEAAHARAIAPKPETKFVDIKPEDVFLEDAIPPGWYVNLRLQRGAAVRIANLSGTPGATLFMWNAEDTSERFNAGDTTKLQWTTNLTTGRVLFSDMGRVLASIVADTGAGHDSIVGPNGPMQTQGRNGRDNLRSAAAKFGLSRRDVAPAISLFSPVAVDNQGIIRWRHNPPQGAMVELRAEMDLLITISNTPHALSPVQEATGPISYIAWRAPTVSAHDLCRQFTEEAARGFINNDRYFAK
ncbi:urea amidolyase associated protein UAAP1 [Acidocella sp.]|uniref:urea amidolyase associated protein UAAP1 n=1 Tax=Acidocella sp. TaxID=50710 RepID=UPI0026133123|nr:urea amidolyase associated protein UAAP1 [Acidocella sp.]